MMLTIHTLFNDPNIVNAVIQRVLKTRKDSRTIKMERTYKKA